MPGPEHAREPPNSTREKILVTAQRLFHARTYSEVGINTLCSEAGVVKGSFYHFFPSKQALLEAVLERNRASLVGGMADSAGTQPDGRSRLLAQFSTFLEMASGQKSQSGQILGCPVGCLASELSPSNEGARSASAESLNQWAQLLEEHVQNGVNDGSIVSTVDPKHTALGLLAVIQGMSTLGRTFNDPDLLTEIAKTCVKRLLPVRAG